jgi:hypothetical protein
MKIIIMGINPSSKKITKGSAIYRLREWIEYLNLPIHSFSNVMLYPGQFKNSLVDYDSINRYIHGYDKVIALGNIPSVVLDKLSVKHFKLPHPSGLNRLLNDPQYQIEQLDLCRNYIHND